MSEEDKQKKAVQNPDQELSPEDLKQVSGGVSPIDNVLGLDTRPPAKPN